MNISCAEMESVVKTLPIGYYAGRRIKVGIDEEAPTSYYSPVMDEICVSYQGVANGLKGVKDETCRESAVRASLYHEVSHAILTPKGMRPNNQINVFEDERIETLLDGYYMDVDFKKNVYLLNGLEPYAKLPRPKNGFDAFYQTVRYRQGKPQFLRRVAEIIDRFQGLNRPCDYWESYDYVQEIEKLYRDICTDFKTNPPPPDSGEGEGEGKGDGKSSGTYGKSDLQDGEGEGESGAGGGSDGEEGAGDSSGEGAPCHGRSGASEKYKKAIQEAFDTVLSQNHDKKLTDALSQIILNFNKKNSGGSSIRSYSGTLNPRSISHEDYRFFDRAMSVNGGNQFGTLHLNLYIDRSGSFYHSQEIVNTLLASLTEIERNNRNFSLDVVFCGCGEEVVKSQQERVIECGGGNDLDDEIYPIFRALQKPSTYNYNIALFDGDAFSDAPRQHRKNFGAFDSNNCTIISDSDNEVYIRGTVTKARVIYTSDYTAELIRNVQQTLERAFR